MTANHQWRNHAMMFPIKYVATLIPVKNIDCNHAGPSSHVFHFSTSFANVASSILLCPWTTLPWQRHGRSAGPRIATSAGWCSPQAGDSNSKLWVKPLYTIVKVCGAVKNFDASNTRTTIKKKYVHVLLFEQDPIDLREPFSSRAALQTLCVIISYETKGAVDA